MATGSFNPYMMQQYRNPYAQAAQQQNQQQYRNPYAQAPQQQYQNPYAQAAQQQDPLMQQMMSSFRQAPMAGPMQMPPNGANQQPSMQQAQGSVPNPIGGQQPPPPPPPPMQAGLGAAPTPSPYMNSYGRAAIQQSGREAYNAIYGGGRGSTGPVRRRTVASRFGEGDVATRSVTQRNAAAGGDLGLDAGGSVGDVASSAAFEGGAGGTSGGGSVRLEDDLIRDVQAVNRPSVGAQASAAQSYSDMIANLNAQRAASLLSQPEIAYDSLGEETRAQYDAAARLADMGYQPGELRGAVRLQDMPSALEAQRDAAAYRDSGFAMQQAQGTGVRPDMAAFNDTMTPTGRSTETPTYGPRDMTNAVAPMRTPYTDPGAGMAEAQNPSVTRQLPQGGLTPEQYMDILRMNNRPTGNANDVQPAPVPSGPAMAQGQQQSPVQSGAAMAAGQQQSPDQVQAAMEAAQAPAVDPLAQQMAMAAGQTQTTDQIGAAMAAAQGAGGGGFVDPYADAAAAQQARQRELLSGLQGGTPAQVDMMYNQAPAYQQQQLLNMGYESQLPTNTGLQFGSSQLGASGATVAQEAMREAQRAALSGVGGYRNPYADAAAAQQPRTPFQPSYADAAAQQPDAGLRTFTGRGERIAGPVGGQGGSDALQQRLEQAYLERIGADDPILASQLADQQLRQQEQERGLIEQLSRYGVLRGGGDTAAVLSRLAEGNERNRLALEASAAGRRQQDLRDALAFDQTRSQMGLAERGQTLQESLGQQSVLNQELSRAAQRAGLTGQFEGQDTLSAQLQRQQMGLASDANQRAERAQQAELLGRVAFDPQTQMALAQAGQDTLAGRELALREQLAQSGDLRAQQAAESALFGRVITGTDAPITTLEGQRTLSDLDAAELAREATEAGLTGRFRGIDTAAERALQSQLSSANLARQLNEAAVTGQYGGKATLQAQELQSALESQDLARRLQEAGVTGLYNNQKTLQAQALEQEMQNQALNRALSRAGATGMFREEGDTGPGVQTLENQLRTAALTGQLGGQNTLAGSQADMDRIAAAIAASDSDLKAGPLNNLAEYLLNNITDPMLARNASIDLRNLDTNLRGRIEEDFGSPVARFEKDGDTDILTLEDGTVIEILSNGTQTATKPDGTRTVRPGSTRR